MHCVEIDQRERRTKLAAQLLADIEFEVSFTHLPLGDYLLDHRLLIERKSLIDLAESIKDGRLFDQALRLAKLVRRKRPAKSDSEASTQRDPKPDGCALLIEGSTEDLQHSAMRPECIRAALACVSVFIGVPVLRTTCAQESAALLRSLAEQARARASGGLPRLGLRPQAKRGLQLYLLQGLPGVGPERAARLLDRFGDVRSVFTADAKQLSAVAGIGKGTARKIVWSVTAEAAPPARADRKLANTTVITTL